MAASFQKNWERELNKAGLVIISGNLIFFTLSLSHYRISFGHKQSVKDGEVEMNSYNHKYDHYTDKVSLLQDTPMHQEQQNGQKRKKSREPSLVMALVRSFGEDFAMTGVLKFFQDLLNFVSPLLLKYV